MERKNLDPNQIVTLNDYPIRNERILKLYFRMFQQAKKIVPPSPVIHRDRVTYSFGNKLTRLYDEFFERNSQADYFLLDGSHKTTAGTLSNNKIPVMVFESTENIREAKRMLKRGELMGLTTGNTIKEVLEILNEHFSKTGKFQTVEEKTRSLIKGKEIPKYMVDYYKGGKI